MWYSTNIKPSNLREGKKAIIVLRCSSMKVAAVLYNEEGETVTAHSEGIDHKPFSSFDLWTYYPSAACYDCIPDEV